MQAVPHGRIAGPAPRGPAPRPASGSPVVFEQDSLRVDPPERLVTVKGKVVDLTPTEYAVLRLLVAHAGKVLTHAHILRSIWGPKSTEQSQYLRVYVSHLRSKLTALGLPPDLIKTETGIGYRLTSR